MFVVRLTTFFRLVVVSYRRVGGRKTNMKFLLESYNKVKIIIQAILTVYTQSRFLFSAVV